MNIIIAFISGKSRVIIELQCFFLYNAERSRNGKGVETMTDLRVRVREALRVSGIVYAKLMKECSSDPINSDRALAL